MDIIGVFAEFPEVGKVGILPMMLYLEPGGLWGAEHSSLCIVARERETH